MNNKFGLMTIMRDKSALTLLARSLQPNSPQVMMEVVRLLAAICLVPPDGLLQIVEAITEAAEYRNLTER